MDATPERRDELRERVEDAGDGGGVHRTITEEAGVAVLGDPVDDDAPDVYTEHGLPYSSWFSSFPAHRSLSSWRIDIVSPADNAPGDEISWAGASRRQRRRPYTLHLMWVMAWRPMTPSGKREREVFEAVGHRCVAEGRVVVEVVSGPPEKWSQLVGLTALEDHFADPPFGEIDADGVVAEVEVAGAGEASPTQFGTDAAAFAMLNMTAPLLDGHIAGENRPRHVAGLLVMVSHSDPFGSAASPGEMLGRRRH